ncbi:MAG: class I SAM-dependent methyltransferase [Rhodospirillaceae bacterium]|nr:class I SAM-dependent methyltransferase [Rhodospirillaceae bacterium]
MVSIGERAAYVLSQAGRVGWYYGQYMVSARLSRASLPPPAVSRPGPGRTVLLREIARLMRRDLRNVADGVYPLPHDVIPQPVARLRETADYFRDLPQVNARRRDRRAAEVSDGAAGTTAGLPAYYLRNFHYQSGGYLTDDSAKRYDHQVEILFGGSADAMRRQALVPLAEFLATRRQSRTRLLDVATGTARFLTFVLAAFPRLQVTGLDLSAAYLRQARRTVARFGRVGLVQAPAEALPLADASQDVITAIYLFHELPRAVRQAVAAEMARVLTPGGRVILVDSLQMGDRSDFDGLLEYFPQAFHEPYYSDYARQDLEALFAGCGLRLGWTDLAFLSKVMVFEKP